MPNIFQLIKDNKSKAVKDIVKANYSILKHKDSDDHTPFYCAVGFDKYEIVSDLLEIGEDPNVTGPKDGLAAMSYYVSVYNAQPMAYLVPMLDLLLRYDANINHMSPFKGSLLMLVSSLNDAELVQYVLDKGAIVGLTNSFGDTALHKAARWSNSLEVIKCLVKANSDVNAINDSRLTALMQAVDGGLKPEFVRFLLEKKADIKAKDEDGNTALHIAMETCTKLSIIEKPTENSLNPLLMPPPAYNPIKEETVIETLKLLIQDASDLDQANKDGVTPRDMVEHIRNKGVREFISNIQSKKMHNPLNYLFSCFGFWETASTQSSSVSEPNFMGQPFM